MATRKQVTEWIKSAAAQGDLKTCTRLYCENRISRAAYDAAVNAGRNFARYCEAQTLLANAKQVTA